MKIHSERLKKADISRPSSTKRGEKRAKGTFKFGFKRREQHVLLFFAVCGLALVLLLGWILIHNRAVQWHAQKVQFSDVRREDGGRLKTLEGRYWLKDGEGLEFSFTVKGDGGIQKDAVLCGAALLSYENTDSLVFHNEKIFAELIKEDGKVLSAAELLLENQTPYPNDETRLYLAFSPQASGKADDGEKLTLRIRSEGLVGRGISLGIMEEEDGTPVVAEVYYRTVYVNVLQSLGVFLTGLLIGMACLLLYTLCGLHFLPSANKAKREPGEGRTGRTYDLSKRGEYQKLDSAGRYGLCKYAAAAVILFSFMGFTWFYAISPMSKSQSLGILCSMERAEKTVVLQAGDALLQEVLPQEDRISGFGILLEANGQQESRERAESITDADSGEGSGGKESVLSWRLWEGNGKGDVPLAVGRSPIGALTKTNEHTGHDKKGEEILSAAKEAVWLPLDSVVSESVGRKMLLEISLESADADGRGADDAFSVKIRTTEYANGHCLLNGKAQDSEMCLLAGYDNNGFLRGMYILLCFLSLVLFVWWIAFRSVSRPSVQVMYLAAALSLGMLFSFMTPAFTVSDERTHIDTIYMMSNSIFGIREIPGPEKLYLRSVDVDASIANTMPVTADRYRMAWEGLFRKAGFAADDSQTRDRTAVSNGSDIQTGAITKGQETYLPVYARTALENVTALNYLPAVAGFSLGRLMDRNLITCVMLARWMNLLACAILMYAAVRRMPFGKAAIAMTGLFPKTLQLMASCSYDGMLIAGSCFLVASVLALAESEDPCVLDIFNTLVAGCFVASNKAGTSLPITGIVFFLPLSAMRHQRCVGGHTGTGSGGGASGRGTARESTPVWSTYRAALSTVGLFAFAFASRSLPRVIVMLTRQSGTESIAAGTKTLYSIADFVHSPGRLARIMVNTLLVRGDGMLGELVGKNLCQYWGFVFAFLLLAILGMTAETPGEKKTGSIRSMANLSTEKKSAPGRIGEERKTCFRVLTPMQRLWILALIATGTFLIFLSMLLGFTEIGSSYVDGLQGRYFLPYMPLVLLFLRTDKVKRRGLSDVEILHAGAYLCLLTLFEIFCAYFHVW